MVALTDYSVQEAVWWWSAGGALIPPALGGNITRAQLHVAQWKAAAEARGCEQQRSLEGSIITRPPHVEGHRELAGNHKHKSTDSSGHYLL